MPLLCDYVVPSTDLLYITMDKYYILLYLLWINRTRIKKWSSYDWVKLIPCSMNMQTQFYNLIFLSKFVSFPQNEFWLFNCTWNLRFKYLGTCYICFNHKVLQIKTGRKSMDYQCNPQNRREGFMSISSGLMKVIRIWRADEHCPKLQMKRIWISITSHQRQQHK
jgi:hypothetical protein